MKERRDDEPAEPDVRQALERGKHTFMGIELFIERGVLVPREETELLGEEAVKVLRGIPGRPRFVDLCTGSGNLACGIAAQLGASQGWALDLSDSCVALARRNVKALGLDPRVQVLQGDLLKPLEPEGLHGSIDVIVCNPPYISSGRLNNDRQVLLENEPREAFDGGPYGLSIHQRVVKEALPFLASGGTLMFEFGRGQERQVQSLFNRVGSYCNLRMIGRQDATPRVAVGVKV